eukprot:5134983-Amphidinium_carterae.1
MAPLVIEDDLTPSSTDNEELHPTISRKESVNHGFLPTTVTTPGSIHTANQAIRNDRNEQMSIPGRLGPLEVFIDAKELNALSANALLELGKAREAVAAVSANAGQRVTFDALPALKKRLALLEAWAEMKEGESPEQHTARFKALVKQMLEDAASIRPDTSQVEVFGLQTPISETFMRELETVTQMHASLNNFGSGIESMAEFERKQEVWKDARISPVKALVSATQRLAKQAASAVSSAERALVSAAEKQLRSKQQQQHP